MWDINKFSQECEDSMCPNKLHISDVYVCYWSCILILSQRIFKKKSIALFFLIYIYYLYFAAVIVLLINNHAFELYKHIKFFSNLLFVNEKNRNNIIVM